MGPGAATPILADTQKRRAYYLYPGRVFASSAPTLVTTILGSCVATCLWDETRKCGGMNHFLLPYGAAAGPSVSRFANVAFQHLLEELARLGASPGTLRAKIFGGASVLEALRSSRMDLGRRNIEAARQCLELEGIPLLAQDVGGRCGRKLLFQTDDGTAWIRKL